MTLAVEVLPSALKELKRAEPRDQRDRLTAAIERLAANPSPPGSTMLEGRLGLRRVRVGDWRIVYQIDRKNRIVTVVAVVHRRDVYRRLAKRAR